MAQLKIEEERQKAEELRQKRKAEKDAKKAKLDEKVKEAEPISAPVPKKKQFEPKKESMLEKT